MNREIVYNRIRNNVNIGVIKNNINIDMDKDKNRLILNIKD